VSELRDMLLAAFVVEHKEHLEGIRTILLTLEQGGGVVGSADLDELFRRAHSLKAAARVCDFPTVEAIGQRLETVFSRMRGAPTPGREVLELVKKALEAVEDWGLALAQQREGPEPGHALEALEGLLKGGTPVQVKPARDDDLEAKLREAFQAESKEHLEGIRAILAAMERGGIPTRAALEEAFRRAHTLKGASRLAELHTIETVAHRLETLFARVRDGTLGLEVQVLRVVGQGLDAIEDGVAAVAERRPPPEVTHVLQAIEAVMAGESSSVPIPEAPPSEEQGPPGASGPVGPAIDTVRISADHLDRLLRSTEEVLTEGLRQKALDRELLDLSRQIDNLEKEWALVRNLAGPALRQLSATPGLAPLARYLSLAEQQVHSLSRRARAVRLAHHRRTLALGLLGGQLQHDVRRVRMVSAASVFQGFRKRIRDLAREEGKEIDFRISGLEIEADRLVLQALKDPLMHILFNAVSHGLETAEERREQGKSAVGRVALHLESAANRLRVRVEDDGRGIDYTRVAEAAVRQRFFSEAQAAAASTEELAGLLFKPGFSTSRAVTGLSGRGMGLSVVQEAVARLQGEIELRPGSEGGTVVQLLVPLVISSQRLLLVSCRGQPFAIPIHGIERLVRVKLEDVEMVEGQPMLLLQGQPIPVLSLTTLLDLPGPEAPSDGDYLPLILGRWGGKRVAVAVEAFRGERDGIIKDLDGPAAQVATLAGGILLEDGSVCLVLNLGEVIRSFKPSNPVARAARASPVPAKKRTSVLVVDDSLTTRTLEKSILETHGYDVRIAVDGIEALTQLQADPADLVITDVQMPRLDGFGLLEAMKKDPRLARIPTIVVTSLGRREDQERGLALGADAYIVKRKFDHEELLETIRQII
jgi:two-component system chemotaxis sensor kinase CheA